MQVASDLPYINFVMAGKGPIKIDKIPNVEDVGFLAGRQLENVINNAAFTILPSECYETFGLSVIESQTHGVPVIGANIGGISNLIKDKWNGALFESGNSKKLKCLIKSFWDNEEITAMYGKNCLMTKLCNVQEYCEELIEVYCGNRML